MEDGYANPGPVDPEVRGWIYSLVTAIGGAGGTEDGRYVLGDDALATLKDITRWIKLYDNKFNRLDVSRCLAEANLVKGDLLEILADWSETETENKLYTKVVLACFELLVPLTWPIEKKELEMTRNHHRHAPYIELAQIGYKRDILEHHSSSILRTMIRVALPSIALPLGERTPKDEGIIKLMLYFFRNIALISAPQNLPVEWNENEVSRSATIIAFHQQEVLSLILTIASNMGEDFNTQDVVILELLFQLLKGINVEKLFLDESQMQNRNTGDLKSLMDKEAAMLRTYSKHAPTRHNRFGTMIWVKRDDERVSTVSGQDILGDNQHTLAKMDKSKRWNRPKRRGKENTTIHSFDMPVAITSSANKYLRSFVEDFLDAGFNPLFSHLRKAIEREAERVVSGEHPAQYFYLISWLLEAERQRRKSRKERDRQAGISRATSDSDSYGLVASVLNQETFVQLNRFMQDRLDLKEWSDLNAGMRCFTQILLTVQEMADSEIEDDQEIADNIQNRIFYEESTHDRIVAILRGYKDQGFNYLDACTELSHVFLRVLERYSKENGDLQIRSRRRARTKKKAEAHPDQDMDQDSEAEDNAEARRVSRERLFDFKRFASKFLTQNCINAFVAFTTYYNDLTNEQLKRAHRFFYRVAFKQEMSVMIFRLDIIALLHRMIKGPDPLAKSSATYAEWEEMSKQLFRRLTKKMQERPELAVELLFSKINSTAYYLEYGYEKQTAVSKPRPAAELEFKDMSIFGSASAKEGELMVATALLHGKHIELIDFVLKVLKDGASQRQSWENENVARSLGEGQPPEAIKAPSIIVNPDNEETRVAMFKDSYLRLLMGAVGFQRLGEVDEPDATWIIPSNVESSALQWSANFIEQLRNTPVTEFGDENPVSAEDLVRRKASPRQKADFDDESEGEDDFLAPEEFLFPAGGPTPRENELAKLNKKRKKRRTTASGDEGGLDEAEIAARRKARHLNDLAKRRKIKSAEFVLDSDDEDDEERDREFFRREEERRQGQAKKALEALHNGTSAPTGGTKKRKRNDAHQRMALRKKARSETLTTPSDTESTNSSSSENSGNLRSMQHKRNAKGQPLDTEDEATETPLSSQPASAIDVDDPIRPALSPVKEILARARATASILDGEGGDDDEDILPTSTARRRGRNVLVDSDDEDLDG